MGIEVTDIVDPRVGREGAYAYLFRQYSVVVVAFVVLSVIFGVLAYYGIQNPFVPVAFLTGGLFRDRYGHERQADAERH